jgi:hypothetical protein
MESRQQTADILRDETICQSLLFYFSQTYTITVELYHALPHAAGRATHALQPARKLGVLLLDLELRARRFGV